MAEGDFNDIMRGVKETAESIKAEIKREKNVLAMNKALLSHSDEIHKKIDTIISPGDKCKYLEKNKETCIKAKSSALNSKDLFNAELHERAIDETIDPLLKYWKEIASEIKDEIQSSKEIKNEEVIVKEAEIVSDPSSNLQINPSSLVNFVQIDCSASKIEILAFWMILAKEKNSKGLFYMKKDDVIDLVNNVFSVFNKPGVAKFYPINLPVKATLTYFIYCFYEKFDHKESYSKVKYVEFLINCFESFKDDNLETLSSNMSASKKPKNSKNVIPIEKYFPKKKKKQ
jgi:hypothetical protein